MGNVFRRWRGPTVTRSTPDSPPRSGTTSSDNSSSSSDDLHYSLTPSTRDTNSCSTHSFPIISWKHITKGEFLGEGSYGKTYGGVVGLPGCPEVNVAIKILHYRTQSLIKEAQVLKDLDGAGGVPRLIGLTEEDPQALLMEFCPGVSLEDFLEDCSPTECRKVLDKLEKALESFHDKGYAHLDLHTNNVIVDPSAENTVHIIDVGLSQKCEKDRSLLQTDHYSLKHLVSLYVS